jgi:pullulanase
LIKVGLTGNLRDYQFVDRTGKQVTGAQVDYNGSPAGYTLDPQESITYVEAHDNQTLYDNNVYKAPRDTTMADRVRMQNLGISIVGLAQGVPFFHAGQDMLRSKSLDRDSYDSGDWFNKLDFSYQTNNFGVGLPPAWANEENWPIMRELLADPTLKPAQADILRAVEHMREMMRVRASSPLFHLQTAADVQQRLSFLNTGANQTPGMIVMRLNDTVGQNLDGRYAQIVVLFNAGDEAQTFAVDVFKGMNMSLHPELAKGSDPVVRTSSYNQATGTFTIPARTTAVFVQPEQNGPPPQRGPYSVYMPMVTLPPKQQ